MNGLPHLQCACEIAAKVGNRLCLLRLIVVRNSIRKCLILVTAASQRQPCRAWPGVTGLAPGASCFQISSTDRPALMRSCSHACVVVEVEHRLRTIVEKQLVTSMTASVAAILVYSKRNWQRSSSRVTWAACAPVLEPTCITLEGVGGCDAPAMLGCQVLPHELTRGHDAHQDADNGLTNH